jgi:hypothetical protein
MNTPIFRTLFLLARPAAGKSEIIDYLMKFPVKERVSRFHIGELSIIDDFPMIWTWFEEDDLLSKMGYPHLYTNENGYFLNNYFWDLLIERINLEFSKIKRDSISISKDKTIIIEFSRGKEHGGYQSAFSHLGHDILSQAAIIYVNVSWEESLRKNCKRFNPDCPDSILEHSIPDEKLKILYYENDWDDLIANHPDHLLINNIWVPYAIFENEDDVTTKGGSVLANRLELVTSELWHLYSEK